MGFVALIYGFVIVALAVAGLTTLVGEVPDGVVVGLGLFLLFAAQPVFERLRDG